MEMADALHFKELENLRSEATWPARQGRPQGEAKPRRNSELRKVLAGEILENRVLEETLRIEW